MIWPGTIGSDTARRGNRSPLLPLDKGFPKISKRATTGSLLNFIRVVQFRKSRVEESGKRFEKFVLTKNRSYGANAKLQLLGTVYNS